jgi:hypothetical protein
MFKAKLDVEVKPEDKATCHRLQSVNKDQLKY